MDLTSMLNADLPVGSSRTKKKSSTLNRSESKSKKRKLIDSASDGSRSFLKNPSVISDLSNVGASSQPSNENHQARQRLFSTQLQAQQPPQSTQPQPHMAQIHTQPQSQPQSQPQTQSQQLSFDSMTSINSAAAQSASVVQQAMNAWSEERLADAENLFVKALQIIYAQVKDAPPSVRPSLMLDIASILHNRGLICRSQGQLANAQKHLSRAFAIFQKLGADEPEVLLILNSIAQLYVTEGRMDEALPLIHRAVELNTRTYGPKHPRVGEALHDLSLLYTKQEKWAEAADAVAKVVAIQTSNMRGDDVATIRLKNSLALLQDKAGRKEESEAIRVEVLKLAEEKYGASHPTVLKHLMNVARAYEIEQKFAPAEHLHARCMQSFAATAGNDSPDVATTMFSLAALYVAQGKFDQAQQLLRRCLELRVKHYGEKHHVVADVYNKIAVVQWGCCQFEDAEWSMKKAVDIFRDVVGTDHEVVKYAEWMLDAIKKRKAVCITKK